MSYLARVLRSVAVAFLSLALINASIDATWAQGWQDESTPSLWEFGGSDGTGDALTLIANDPVLSRLPQEDQLFVADAIVQFRNVGATDAQVASFLEYLSEDVEDAAASSLAMSFADGGVISVPIAVIVLGVLTGTFFLYWAMNSSGRKAARDVGANVQAIVDTLAMAAARRTGTCSCQHRDIFQSGGVSCQTLRERGVCVGPYRGVGTNTATCQDNARSNAPAACQGCLGHCLFRRGE
jgi:hypothetical protein